MKPLLGTACAGILAELAACPSLLAFDFDGTLAPIGLRETAAMQPTTLQLFAELCRRYPCAVISGRSRADTESRLAGTAPAYVIGNHGLEPSELMRSLVPDLDEIRRSLLGSLGSDSEVDIEDKRYSVALHYRAARDKRRALANIRAAVARLAVPVRLVAGKLVVNVVHAQAPHKGDALGTLIARERAQMALFAGDDVTDEDAFALAAPNVVTVRIGACRRTRAQYYLREQHDIDRLLARLVAARDRGPDGATFEI